MIQVGIPSQSPFEKVPDSGADIERRPRKAYQNDVLQDILNRSLFRTKKQDGARFRDIYCEPDGLTHGLIALLATAVRLSINKSTPAYLLCRWNVRLRNGRAGPTS